MDYHEADEIMRQRQAAERANRLIDELNADADWTFMNMIHDLALGRSGQKAA